MQQIFISGWVLQIFVIQAYIPLTVLTTKPTNQTVATS